MTTRTTSSIHGVLKTLGLSATEQRLYRAGLMLGTASARDLARTSGVQRTTSYHALNLLTTKGLVATTGSGSRTMFTMTPPEHLEKLITTRIASLQRQVEAVRSITPLLAKRMAHETDTTQVFKFEGVAGIKAVVEKALYCKNRSWDIIAPRKNFFSEFDLEYAKYFIETRKARGIKARSLWEQSMPGRRLSAEEIALRSPRYLPKHMEGHFQSVVIIFDDKVAFISSKAAKTAVLIQSTELSTTMRTMFEGLWRVSKTY